MRSATLQVKQKSAPENQNFFVFKYLWTFQSVRVFNFLANLKTASIGPIPYKYFERAVILNIFEKGRDTICSGSISSKY